MLMTDAAFQLTISAVGLATMISTSNSAIDDALAMGTGQYMANVAQAVNTYVFDNMTVLAGSPAGPTSITAGSVTATVPSPLHPTIQDLVNLKLLPIGFSDASPLGLAFKVDLIPTNCSAGLTNCTIPGQMYSTTAYRDASGSIRSDLMAAAVQAAGVDGGASYAETPGVITGMAASWAATNPLPGGAAGVLMMRVGNTSLLAQSMNQFYKRDGSLNLTGPMDANNQAMNRVGNFQSNGSVSAAGNVAAAANVSGNGVYGNYVQSNGNVVAVGQVVGSQVASNGSVTSAGNMVASGYLYAAGALVPSIGGGQQVMEGWGCGDPQGAIRSDPNGKTMSCQNGVWRSAGGVSQGVVVGMWSANSANGQYHGWGLCITWPGGTGYEADGGFYGKTCPDGTVQWKGGADYQGGGGGG
ncbi:hypothetical protein SAMN05216345_111102 [Cupriavidus sp. YR651]|uniref:adhesin n=1 Tax=Cupriavidus sp. YR651 TaxID=1855315 RepID=UPI00087F640F|nr:adhesin [Cupriavidus sp. YR651]SDD57489.1 hypothetical protein SAMN05216345_111102 [Cupriavidus sp. YR651]